MAAAAIAPYLAPNANVWVYGQTTANPIAANPKLLAPYGFSELSLATKHVAMGGVTSCVARASWRGVPRELEKEKELAAWGQDSTLSLTAGDNNGAAGRGGEGGGILPWRTYPGLFAGGQLDVMTHFLLHTVPMPTHIISTSSEPVQVLDFACGSGSIGATILARVKAAGVGDGGSVNIHLLDADAVAIKAAKVNVSEQKLSPSFSRYDH